MNQTNIPIPYVVTCYKKHNQLNWQSLRTFGAVQSRLSLWAVEPNRTIAIRTNYRAILPNAAMPSAVDINLTKLSVKYTVVLKTNSNRYGTKKVTYSNLEDLLYSVLNYLEVSGKTKMTRDDILVKGVN